MFMKKMYISPVVEIVASQLDQEVLAGHSGEWGDAKEQTFENEETFFNPDKKNIWAEEVEEE